MSIEFLSSNRFWGAVAICVLSVLKTYSILGAEIVDPLVIFLFTFIGVRSIDRFSEKVGA
jgi:hypothetical protein